MNAEQLANLPNLAAMVLLIASMLYLRKRQTRLDISSWLVALALMLVSQLSWYGCWNGGRWILAMHAVRLDADLLAGMVFLLFTGRHLANSPQRVAYFAWSAVPFLALETIYGFYLAKPAPYALCAVAGITLALINGRIYARPVSATAALAATWAAIGSVAVLGHYRTAAYWGLASVYASAGVNLWHRLPERSAGRIAMVTSFGIWTLTFLVHPWIITHPLFRPVGDHIWAMQRFFVALGMLMVLLEEEIRENRRMAVHDQLTGLPNRRIIEDRLRSAVEHGHAGVLMLDLDGFKQVNDNLGHLAGDRLLQRVADILRQLVDADETLARVGGDEFLIVSPRPLEHTAMAVRAVLREPILLDDHEVTVGASVGIATFPADVDEGEGDIAERLIRLADRRMYTLKQREGFNATQPARPRYSANA